MSDRLDFKIVCPNNHNQTVAFSHDKFEAALKLGETVFHCMGPELRRASSASPGGDKANQQDMSDIIEAHGPITGKNPR